MQTFRFCTLAVLTLLVLLGCAPQFMQEREGRKAVDDFIYTLRWMQLPAAAGFMRPELQQDFLDQFKRLQGDLTIIDVRLTEVTVLDESRRVETGVEMDYYLLPSTVVKTLEIAQVWACVEKACSAGDYLITTPFPEISRD